jgi:MarR family transcriptional regulator, organic hydroperoxide resistance regulator
MLRCCCFVTDGPTVKPKIRRPAAHGAEMRASELPDALQFMRLLWALVHGLQRQSKRMKQRVGVTGPQRLVLRVVGLFPGISAGTLAAILHVHPSTLTGVLQRLVAQGSLRRTEHAGDRRRSVLLLTKKGARINALRTGTVETAVVTALEQVRPRERVITQQVLSRIADCLGETGGGPKWTGRPTNQSPHRGGRPVREETDRGPRR